MERNQPSKKSDSLSSTRSYDIKHTIDYNYNSSNQINQSQQNQIINFPISNTPYYIPVASASNVGLYHYQQPIVSGIGYTYPNYFPQTNIANTTQVSEPKKKTKKIKNKHKMKKSTNVKNQEEIKVRIEEESKVKKTTSGESNNKLDSFSSLEESYSRTNNSNEFTASQLTVKKGSQKLQKVISSITSEAEISQIYFKLKKENLISIANNQFGNFFLQKFILKLNSYQMKDLWETLMQTKYEILFDEFGNRVMHTLMNELIEIGQFEMILNDIKPLITLLAYQKYGVFTLQKLLENSKVKNEIAFISEFVQESFYSLCCHMNGVYLLKRYVLFALKNGFNFLKNTIIDKYIIPCIDFISNDKYGHFLILWLYEHVKSEDMEEISQLILKRFDKAITSKCSRSVLVQAIKTQSLDVSLRFIILDPKEGS